MPENVKFFDPKAGTITVDIVPYICGKGNPKCDADELYYERTFYKYRKVGAAGHDYVASGKTFGKPDYIADWISRELRKENPDHTLIDSLPLKERQLFLLIPEGGTQLHLWEFSFHLFGKLLDSRIKNSKPEQGWDWFFYDNEEGMSLNLTFEDKSGGGENWSGKWVQCTAIDFIPRKKSLPDWAVAENHGICLDDLLIETPYMEMKAIFHGIDPKDIEGMTDAELDHNRPPSKTEAKEEAKEAAAAGTAAATESSDVARAASEVAADVEAQEVAAKAKAALAAAEAEAAKAKADAEAAKAKAAALLEQATTEPETGKTADVEIERDEPSAGVVDEAPFSEEGTDWEF